MKYSILGFNQFQATNFKLDHSDLLILRWFIDFKDTQTMKKRLVNDSVYYWIKYEAIIEDLPIINLKKDTIYRRLKKLVKCKILNHTTIKEGGTWSFYSVGENYKDLISSDNSFENINEINDNTPSEDITPVEISDNSQGNESESNGNGIASDANGAESVSNGCKVGTNNPSTKSIYYNNKYCLSADAEEIWSLYPNKKGKAQAMKKIPKILKAIGKEALINAVLKYSEEASKVDNQYVLYGSSFFNGRYEDYLHTSPLNNPDIPADTGDSSPTPKYIFILDEEM